jgi:hypothetical protein
LTGYFSNSTGSFVNNCWFSPIIASGDKYGRRAKLEKFKAQNYCLDCRRLQFRVQSLEAQMAEYRMNDKKCQTLKSEQLENERLKKRVEALKIKRDPIAGLHAKVDRLERSQRRNEEPLCALELELQRARESIEWFRERNEWLENRVQVLAMQHTQQRNMIQVLGERSK